MKILVGTLFTGEQEFNECVQGIRQQTYPDWEHFVVSNLANQEAHHTLYRTFMERADTVDLFIKVDADMVIENRHLFARIVSRFEALPDLDRLSIAVHDFFSDRLIFGMHTYRNSVRWERNGEKLFVDCLAVRQHRGLDDDTELAPAAVHCKNPSLFQAFHYGAHRGLKIVQRQRPRAGRVHLKMRDHWDVMQATQDHFRRTGDRRLGMACLGSELAIRGGFEPQHLDYQNAFFRREFATYEQCGTAELRSLIKRLQATNGGLLPARIRRDWLWYKNSSKRLSVSALASLARRIATG